MSQGPNNEQYQETLEPGHLMAQLESAIAVMRTQQATIADQQARIEELGHRLEQMFHEKRTRSEATTKDISAIGETSSDQTMFSVSEMTLKRRLPDLLFFSGDQKNYRTWALEVRTKLDIDKTVIDIFLNQFFYLFAKIELKAQNIVVVYFEKEGQERKRDPIEFLRYFDSVFLDPNSAI